MKYVAARTKRKPLVAVVGPTAVGKSRLAEYLALHSTGEIIGADSRQIYRYMDIGTAKPDADERETVPHHLIDIIDPDEQFSLARFQELAYRTVEDILERGHLPFIVGGTGLYMRAVLEGWQTPGVSPDPEFRYNMEEKARQDGGPDALYAELVRMDPDAADKIDRRNIRRVIRALEVLQTGSRFSQAGTRKTPPYDRYVIGLTAERDALYTIADRRVDAMLEQGLVREVETLLEKGYGLELPSMSGIGYRQIGMYLAGDISLDEAIRRIKTATHRFIRHQYAWFRLDDTTVHWYDVTKTEPADIMRDLAGFIEG